MQETSIWLVFVASDWEAKTCSHRVKWFVSENEAREWYEYRCRMFPQLELSLPLKFTLQTAIS